MQLNLNLGNTMKAQKSSLKKIGIGKFMVVGLIASSCILFSCQKRSISKTGYFTKLNTTVATRAPASALNPEAAKTLEMFKTFQDSKQILVFCKLNSIRTSQCYQEKFNVSFRDFAKKHGPLSAEAIQAIKDHNKFDHINSNLVGLESLIMGSVDPKINQITNDRSKFCKINATVNLHKCLNQFIKRDTFAVLNNFQHENATLNGQEYLYVKSLIEVQLKERLFQAKHNLKKANRL
jgi:hypothetical protein